MLSGIGPADHLNEVGITCHIKLPSVGQNLQNHPIIYQHFATTSGDTMNKHVRSDRMAAAGARWKFPVIQIGEMLAPLQSRSILARDGHFLRQISRFSLKIPC